MSRTGLIEPKENMMDKQTAQGLFESLKDHLVNADRILVEIIKTKAWEPLGYPDFVSAWDDRLAGVRLATDVMRAHVVYALIESDLCDEEIIERTFVGDSTVKEMRRQKKIGVPADRYSRRQHTASKPRRPQCVRVEFDTHEDFEFLRDAAVTHGTTLPELAKALLWEWARDPREVR